MNDYFFLFSSIIVTLILTQDYFSAGLFYQIIWIRIIFVQLFFLQDYFTQDYCPEGAFCVGGLKFFMFVRPSVNLM